MELGLEPEMELIRRCKYEDKKKMIKKNYSSDVTQFDICKNKKISNLVD